MRKLLIKYPKHKTKLLNLMKKNIDLKIKTLIENAIKTRHRTFFIIIGNKGHEQVILNPLKQLTILQKGFQFSFFIIQDFNERTA